MNASCFISSPKQAKHAGHVPFNMVMKVFSFAEVSRRRFWADCATCCRRWMEFTETGTRGDEANGLYMVCAEVRATGCEACRFGWFDVLDKGILNMHVLIGRL